MFTKLQGIELFSSHYHKSLIWYCEPWSIFQHNTASCHSHGSYTVSIFLSDLFYLTHFFSDFCFLCERNFLL